MHVGTADSMEGSEARLVITTSVVTHELGFVDDRHRLLVMTTRAQDYFIFLANTLSIMRRPSSDNNLLTLYDMAKSNRRICRIVTKDHPFLKHEFFED